MDSTPLRAHVAIGAVALCSLVLLAPPALSAEPPIDAQEGATYPLGSRISGPCDPDGDPDGGLSSEIEYRGYRDKRGRIRHRDHPDLHNDWANSGSPSGGWWIRPPDCRPLTVRHRGLYTMWTYPDVPDAQEPLLPPSVHFEVSNLSADAGGPYKVRRGRRVRLDGSGSRPRQRIRSYRWTFAPVTSEGPPVAAPATVRSSASSADGAARKCRPRPKAVKRGKQVTIEVICPITATLTVEDEGGEDSDTVEITLRPGGLKRVPYLPPAPDVPYDYVLHTLHRHYGRNVNALADTSRIVNRPSPPIEAREVTDSGGPFDGMWYVTDHHYAVKRQSRINKEMYATWCRTEKGKRKCETPDTYALNVENGTVPGLEKMRRAVVKHEHTHADLIARAMSRRGFKPHEQLESLVAGSKDNLIDRADGVMAAAEKTLCLATTEANVQAELRRFYGGGTATFWLLGAATPVTEELAFLSQGGLTC